MAMRAAIQLSETRFTAGGDRPRASLGAVGLTWVGLGGFEGPGGGAPQNGKSEPPGPEAPIRTIGRLPRCEDSSSSWTSEAGQSNLSGTRSHSERVSWYAAATPSVKCISRGFFPSLPDARPATLVAMLKAERLSVLIAQRFGPSDRKLDDDVTPLHTPPWRRVSLGHAGQLTRRAGAPLPNSPAPSEYQPHSLFVAGSLRGRGRLSSSLDILGSLGTSDHGQRYHLQVIGDAGHPAIVEPVRVRR